jgi:DNA polymerase (family 10)
MNNNAELALVFHKMACCYRYLGRGYRYRANAFDEASHTLHRMAEDVSQITVDLTGKVKFNGIDENIRKKIIEYLRTGKIKAYERLKKRVPADLIDLMDVTGFGPSVLKTLHEKLHINDRQELIMEIVAGSPEIKRLFDSRKIENMKQGLHLFSEMHNRLLLCDALEEGNILLKAVQSMPGVKKAALTGSLRRKKKPSVI